MFIHVLPLVVDAAADLETGDVFVARRLLSRPAELIDNLRHEFAHLIVGHGRHDHSWGSVFSALGGRRQPTLQYNTSIPLCFNIGNISGIQGLLVDYHALQAYRKFSKRVLGTEGHWECIHEVDGDSTKQLIRLYPTPKGVFPVVVLYQPVFTQFRTPQAKKLCMDMILAEAKVTLGHVRRKLANMPSPTGGTLSTDGDALVQEGTKELDEILTKAMNWGDPLMPEIH